MINKMDNDKQFGAFMSHCQNKGKSMVSFKEKTANDFQCESNQKSKGFDIHNSPVSKKLQKIGYGKTMSSMRPFIGNTNRYNIEEKIQFMLEDYETKSRLNYFDIYSLEETERIVGYMNLERRKLEHQLKVMDKFAFEARNAVFCKKKLMQDFKPKREMSYNKQYDPDCVSKSSDNFNCIIENLKECDKATAMPMEIQLNNCLDLVEETNSQCIDDSMVYKKKVETMDYIAQRPECKTQNVNRSTPRSNTMELNCDSNKFDDSKKFTSVITQKVNQQVKMNYK